MQMIGMVPIVGSLGPKIPPAPPEKPFALRSLIYTIGFLLVVLGVVPSVFFLVGRLASTGLPARVIIQEYWTGLRALVGNTAPGRRLYTALMPCARFPTPP